MLGAWIRYENNEVNCNNDDTEHACSSLAGCLGGDDDEDEKTTVKIGFLNPITGPLEPMLPCSRGARTRQSMI